jgi:hypothetical protein
MYSQAARLVCFMLAVVLFGSGFLWRLQIAAFSSVEAHPCVTPLGPDEEACPAAALGTVQACTPRIFAACRSLSTCGSSSAAEPLCPKDHRSNRRSVFGEAVQLARNSQAFWNTERCNDKFLSQLKAENSDGATQRTNVARAGVFCEGYFCRDAHVRRAASTGLEFRAVIFNSRVSGFEEGLPTFLDHVAANRSNVAYVSFLSYNDYNGEEPLRDWLVAMSRHNMTTVVQRQRYLAPDSWTPFLFGKEGLLAEGWVNIFAAFLFNRKNAVRMLEDFETASSVTFGFVLFLRPDMIFRSEVPWALADGVDVYVPPAPPPQKNDYGGINDQIALCRGRSAAAYYASLAVRVQEYCREGQPMHPELLLQRHLRNISVARRPRVLYHLSGSRRKRSCSNHSYTHVKVAVVCDDTSRHSAAIMVKFAQQWVYRSCSACLSSKFYVTWRLLPFSNATAEISSYGPSLVILFLAEESNEKIAGRAARFFAALLEKQSMPPIAAALSPLPEFSSASTVAVSRKKRVAVNLTVSHQGLRIRAAADELRLICAARHVFYLDLHASVLDVLRADASRSVRRGTLFDEVPLELAAGQDAVRRFFGPLGRGHHDRPAGKMLATLLLDFLFRVPKY